MLCPYLKFKKDQSGTLIIELALVVGLLAFAAMGGLEIAFYIQRSQTGVSLSRELVNRIARDCYEVCEPSVTSSCAAIEVANLQAIANQIDPTMRVRARIWQRRLDIPSANTPRQCTLDTGWVYSVSGNGTFLSDKASYRPDAIRNNDHPSGIQIIAEVEADHTPLTGFALAIFGNDRVYYHGTLI